MSEPPQPRQCLVKKWPDFDGYGFNLHAEKNKPGQFIGKIDPGSPAEAAGLKEGDRIVEVNGVNVNQENHKQVVQRIKAVPNETNLLVVDKKCEEFHKQNEIIVKSSLSYVLHLSSEKEEEIIDDEEVIDTRLQEVSIEDHQEEDDDVQDSISESSSSPPPSVHNGSVEREDSMMSNRSSVISTKVQEPEVEIEPEMNSPVPTVDEILEDKLEEINISDSEETPIEIETESIPVSKPDDEQVSLSSEDSLVASSLEVSPLSERKVEMPLLVPEPKKETPNSLSSGSPRSTPSPTLGKVDGLDLNITAKEMRERIGSRKKRDPRKDNRMDFRKKHEIIQTL
eukprot:GFUD01001141.1.p1 GENE.GFUD01001141.1~~GFUD01001141.1.p1  ORF type:complete len:340 (+),score=112.47 GFUD01001141.1:66-1085(+)